MSTQEDNTYHELISKCWIVNKKCYDESEINLSERVLRRLDNFDLNLSINLLPRFAVRIDIGKLVDDEDRT